MEFFLFSLLLSCPSAIGDWLTWQTNKEDTFLKAGSWTIKFGKTLGWSIKITCYVFVYLLSEKKITSIIINYIFLWFISGWIATLIERKIYERKDEIIFFAKIANDLAKEHGKDIAKILISKNIPDWWLKLMSPSWQNEYYKKMEEIFREH